MTALIINDNGYSAKQPTDVVK